MDMVSIWGYFVGFNMKGMNGLYVFLGDFF